MLLPMASFKSSLPTFLQWVGREGFDPSQRKKGGGMVLAWGSSCISCLAERVRSHFLILLELAKSGSSHLDPFFIFFVGQNSCWNQLEFACWVTTVSSLQCPLSHYHTRWALIKCWEPPTGQFRGTWSTLACQALQSLWLTVNNIFLCIWRSLKAEKRQHWV